MGSWGFIHPARASRSQEARFPSSPQQICGPATSCSFHSGSVLSFMVLRRQGLELSRSKHLRLRLSCLKRCRPACESKPSNIPRKGEEGSARHFYPAPTYNLLRVTPADNLASTSAISFAHTHTPDGKCKHTVATTRSKPSTQALGSKYRREVKGPKNANGCSELFVSAIAASLDNLHACPDYPFLCSILRCNHPRHHQ